MKNSNLKNDVRLLVERYGVDAVYREMRAIVSSEKRTMAESRKPLSEDGTQAKPGTKRKSSRVTATEYVSRMDIAAERRVSVLTLAKRFEEKSFLPTYADIQDFCRIYGIEEPASKVRANVIPRVFKFLATMEVRDVRRLLDENAFSGPARLGPIADAIRRHGRAARGRQVPL